MRPRYYRTQRTAGMGQGMGNIRTTHLLCALLALFGLEQIFVYHLLSLGQTLLQQQVSTIPCFSPDKTDDIDAVSPETNIEREVVVHPCKDGAATVEGKRYTHKVRCNPSSSSPVVARTTTDASSVDDYDLHVVYFLNCYIRDGYGTWMDGQLRHVPDNAYLKIVATSRDCKKETILYEKYRELLGRRTSAATVVECHDEPEGTSTFEYHGIRAAWEIGQMSPRPNSVVFYFHSKGLTHWNTFEEYVKGDSFHPNLSEMNLRQVERVLEAFDLFPDIHTAGTQVSRVGWVWQNMWFARGSYLHRVEEPLLTERRHYYEEWLARTDFPTQFVNPANADDNRQWFRKSCHGYNLIVRDSMASLGLWAPEKLDNDFNVGVYWLPSEGVWEVC